MSVGPTPRGGTRPLSYREAVHSLASAQKPSSGAPAYSRLINRPAGRLLAAVAYRAGLRPDAVTMLSGACSLMAIAVLALRAPGWGTAVLTCGGLVVGYALDSADGQLARLLGGGSAFGEWLDHMVDAVKISALHLAVLISMYRFFELSNAGWLLVPVGFALVAAVMFFGLILIDLLRRDFPRDAPRASQPSGWVRSLLVLPSDYGLLCVIFLLLGVRQAFLGAYAVLLLGNAVLLALAVRKWGAELKAIDLLRAERV